MLYNFKEIEEKWQRYWQENNIFKAKHSPEKKKFYCLEMFPYPSGKTHMGHVRNYTIGDVYSRYQRLKGCEVLHPMGFDAFGQPAENAAIKNQTKPDAWTHKCIDWMKIELKKMGFSYDWDREVSTCDSSYYRWNQWIFLKMFERGLAYKKASTVNWCPGCQTTLANEEVIEGGCWRCHTTVEPKELEQWYLKISEYKERLLEDLKQLKDWPQRVIAMQGNWIGRSQGAEIYFRLQDSDKAVTVFTTRADTIFGATYVVLAPEHPLVKEIIRGRPQEKEALAFIEKVSRESKLSRVKEDVKKEGVWTGAYCVNPVNREVIPVWIADYVLMEYGSGAIMAVPAHDQRDFLFAKEHHLPMRIVIKSPGHQVTGSPEEMTEAYEGDGLQVNSGEFDGLANQEAKIKIAQWMEKKGVGKTVTHWRLRDWLISRQRYWGTPIPIVYCPECGVVPVPYAALPVELPEDVEWRPTGESPLKLHPTWKLTTCPTCGKPAERDTDTMDTFMCSSWYHLRYLSPSYEDAPFDPQEYDYWMPVDSYTGGAEHATMHLIYTRFFHKALRDLGIAEGHEPMLQLRNQGQIL